MLHIIQVFILCSAFVVVMTRVVDNKHHVTDVIAGSSLGIVIALITFYYLNRFYRVSEINIKNRSKSLSRDEYGPSQFGEELKLV
jgi:membrane-associated phospholipid phosphatase